MLHLNVHKDTVNVMHMHTTTQHMACMHIHVIYCMYIMHLHTVPTNSTHVVFCVASLLPHPLTELTEP